MKQFHAQRPAALRFAPWIAALIVATGCGSSPSDEAGTPTAAEQTPTSAASDPTSTPEGRPPRSEPWQPSADPTKLAVHGVMIDVPRQWREQRPMLPTRAANYTVPGQGDDDQAEFVVVVFPKGLGGSNDDNILRWRQQFLLEGEEPASRSIPDALVENNSPGPFPATIVSIEGQMARPGLNWYVPNQRMLAALIQVPEGLLVIRLTGPKGTIDANEPRFRNLIETMRVHSK